MSLVLLSFEFVKAPTAPTKTKTPRVGRFDCPLTACEHFYKRKGDLKAHMLKKHAASETAAFLTSIMKARSSVDGKPFVCPHPRCRHGYLRSRGLYACPLDIFFLAHVPCADDAISTTNTVADRRLLQTSGRAAIAAAIRLTIRIE
jgi:hypothetical protein